MSPAGDWELALLDEPLTRSWLTNGLIDDIVLVLTVSGTTPEWP